MMEMTLNRNRASRTTGELILNGAYLRHPTSSRGGEKAVSSHKPVNVPQS